VFDSTNFIVFDSTNFIVFDSTNFIVFDSTNFTVFDSTNFIVLLLYTHNRMAIHKLKNNRLLPQHGMAECVGTFQHKISNFWNNVPRAYWHSMVSGKENK
jgi:hypothetical protein